MYMQVHATQSFARQLLLEFCAHTYRLQSSAKRLFLGCVTRGRSRGEFTQPRKHLLADLCTRSQSRDIYVNT